jgi:hypothetical protein
MDSVYDKVKGIAKGLQDKYNAGNKETSGIGSELSARSEMNRQGEAALNNWTPKETPSGSPVASHDTGKRYGDRPGEKRLDSKGDEIPKYHTGVDSVPKTGLAVLKKGEKVVPAEHNPDNPDNKNTVEQAVDGDEAMEHSPEEKAHFHRAMAHLHGGALHRHFGIPEDQPIPMEKKQEAANSSNPHTAAMGRMAVAMHGWKHGKK